MGNLLGGSGGLPIVGDLLGGGANGLPIVGGLVSGVVPSLLGTVTGLLDVLTKGLLGQAGGVVAILPLHLECLKIDEIKQRCSLAQAVTLCQATDCKNTQVCVDVCVNLLNNLLGAVTGQCVCQQGFYADKQGTCISLQTCLDVNLNASGRKKRDLLGGLPVVGSLLGGGANGLPIVGGLVSGVVPSLLGTVTGLLDTLTKGLLGQVGADGLVAILPLHLECLKIDDIKQRCSLAQAVTLCQKTDCQHTAVCVDVCVNLLNNLLGAVTGQCVCQQGYYADKQGTCISLQTCLDVNLNASG